MGNKTKADVDELSALLRSTVDESFRPGFERRVMQRLGMLESDPWAEFTDWLSTLFPRVVFPALALSVLLLWNNARLAEDGVALVDAMFGLPGAEAGIDLATLAHPG